MSRFVLCGMLTLSAVVCGSLVFAQAANREDKESDQVSLQTYLSNARDYEGREEGKLANRLPRWIELDIRPGDWGRDEPVPGAMMRFVLVEPADLIVDGVQMSVERPFYIATTELTLKQAGFYAAPPGMGMKEDLERWRGIVRAKLTGLRAYQKDQEKVLAYLENWQYPYIFGSLPQAANFTANLTLHSGMYVRLPTVAEWYLAMRAGRSTAFWWGDEWDPAQAGIEMPKDIEVKMWPIDRLQAVTEGKPNPLGLYHVIGNVSEIVYPSDEERKILRHHFWEPGLHLYGERAWGKSVYTGQYTSVQLGGDVRNIVQNNVPHGVVGLEEAIAYQQGFVRSFVDAETTVGVDVRAFKGMRLVVELPPEIALMVEEEEVK